ncbi:MAG TPA: NAD(P)-binding protein, partial [Solimonas sp.]|nr:NAD(P)-binding protein [Solimonas sp.]
MTAPQAEPAPRRVVILGGGIGALSTAWHLSSEPDWQQKYSEITVYQPGWRLGGKCASSRNPQAGWRNEEHGLHMWFGFYENAFHMLRSCYAERQADPQLARPAGSPLASFDAAFEGRDEVSLMRFDGSSWRRELLAFGHDASAGAPGDGHYREPGAYELLGRLLGMLAQQARSAAPGWLPWRSSYLKGLPRLQQAQARQSGNGGGALQQLRRLFESLPALFTLDDLLFRELGELFGRLRSAARQSAPADDDRPQLPQVRLLLELGLTILRGVVSDGVLRQGLGCVDHLEFRAWLGRHGASAEALASTPVRALYSATLAYEDGDLNRPNMAASVALGLLLRIGLCWRGHAMYKMQAGMGETVIAPLYQVLQRRGVKFRFFHQVTRLEPDPQDRRRIGRIHLGLQATVAAGVDQYQPLVAVGAGQLPCWPAEPLYAQLREGEELQRRGVELESHWSDWEDVGSTVLEVTADDVVVLGISLGALAPICAPLREHNEAWDLMLRELPVVETQSAQIWLNRSPEQLGWRGRTATMVAAPEPHNVWADMSQVIATEDWGPNPPLASIYLCGPLAGNFSDAPRSDRGTPQRALATVRAETLRWLQNYGGWIWP